MPDAADQKMRAQVLTEFGDPGTFEEQWLPIPVARPGEVLIRLAATSLNPIDLKIRRGLPIAPDAPVVLGSDIAGTVVAVGDDVTRFERGDEVFGCGGGVKGLGGTLAEYIAVDARLLARKPTRLSMRETAALPLVAITAWEACDRPGLTAGDKLLVFGGLGGVGHIVVQLAKARGARVTATVSSDASANVARDLGADTIINYRTEDLAERVAQITDGQGFSVVIDTVGGDNLAQAFAAAAAGGRIATTNARTTQDLGPLHAKAISLHCVFMLLPLLTGVRRAAHGAILEKVAALVDQGAVRPLVDDTQFTMNDIASAHRYFEEGKVRGKLVITID